MNIPNYCFENALVASCQQDQQKIEGDNDQYLQGNKSIDN